MNPPAILRLALASALAIAFVAGPGAVFAAKAMKVEGLDVLTHHGARHFTVEIADTPARQERGLMFRRHLDAGRGMLFDFHNPQTVSFWMKNTLIPLDIIFIDADGRIEAIAANAKPMSEDLIPSGGPILAVLELRGGRATEIGAEVGDQVREEMVKH